MDRAAVRSVPPGSVPPDGAARPETWTCASVTGLESEACRGRAEEFVLDGVTVRVIGLYGLLRDSRAPGRPRDLDDIERLG